MAPTQWPSLQESVEHHWHAIIISASTYDFFPNLLSAGALPVVHTLTRVQKPAPTQRHPLAGLWRSTGMLHTCIMAVRYDFSYAAASIVASQVSPCCTFASCYNFSHPAASIVASQVSPCCTFASCYNFSHPAASIVASQVSEGTLITPPAPPAPRWQLSV